ncbi:hypothetical protein [Actinopolymorpha pittospori]|uniref:Uncharacterized protein n=1 Tax=Actinopolymorpha pittospori TaxID=648752 RepID=A0A927N0E2_9ACTN|nr:hypothetical protein [Actinopolymorpha pittospori]MBE1609956.1 hypothetical protein [Actinopolymorpha pittospori]
MIQVERHVAQVTVSPAELDHLQGIVKECRCRIKDLSPVIGEITSTTCSPDLAAARDGEGA